MEFPISDEIKCKRIFNTFGTRYFHNDYTS